MIKVITSPELYDITGLENEICCFLAGGITNCPDWQSEVIEEIKRLDEAEQATGNYVATDYTLVIFNPRRENFPINDPTAARNQITWEFDNLETSDIFSMYFCGGESDQPICMYELGRNTTLYTGIYDDPTQYMCISVENNYKRKQDVEIQMELALDGYMQDNGMDSILDFINEGDHDQLVLTHAFDIYSTFKLFVQTELV